MWISITKKTWAVDLSTMLHIPRNGNDEVSPSKGGYNILAEQK